MPCCNGQDYDRMFDAKTAQKELRKYRKRGPTGETKRLLDAVTTAMRDFGIASFTHLDIGGGIGVLQHELVKRGATHTTAVDASRAYLELLEKGAQERGYIDRHVRLEGDFVQVAADVPTSTLVTLDKVICCYPDMPALVRASAGAAERLWAVVVPRDDLLVRLGSIAGNLWMRHVMRWSFQSFVHAHEDIDHVCESVGFKLHTVNRGMVWTVRVYARA